MSRAALIVILLAATPAASAPVNTFDETAPLRVDTSGGATQGDETAADLDDAGEPAAKESESALLPVKYAGAASPSVAFLEPPAPLGEARESVDAAPVVITRHVPRRTPRFDIGAGVFLQSRGIAFDYDTTVDGPPAYEDGLQGFAVAASVYPFPTQAVDGKLSGIGFSLKLHKAIGATLIASDETGTGEYEVQHSTYDAAVHYRYPIEEFTIEGEVSYGGWGHTVVDLPESIAVPDTSYHYLGLGARAEAAPSERASLGAEARYLRISDSGDVTSQDWYGAGDAHGWVLAGDVTVTLPASLFIRAGVEWRKITLELDGSGELSDWWGVGTFYDTSVTGSALVGAQF